ncbi:diacylglycerol/lipid kinase family protein [Taibaiella chishuiensis]|uniref:YegS/Rv2252/BmrU family lipid kinase n=1 Tax=Taibaiella chishuiensis TaxID=1434707 RepID=A0A2P8D5H5_9BACT|nr:YegS/Rv2252/BmrU family lipid kinase [Taibaiella chishuiensis]PSK92449.1 YegS/Rv2252/BmrU family lipid kinase [Taibaiella chishuiensis]
MTTTTITPKPKLLFIINEGSGNQDIDFGKAIDDFFSNKPGIPVEKIQLQQPIDCDALEARIKASNAGTVIAVGGDGTIKLVAGMITGTDMALGILPAGSANGMARELGIPPDPVKALELICNGQPKAIHMTRINNELCIHLGDIGFNAFIVKKFETLGQRGIWGYVKAAWKVLWQHSRMQAEFHIEGKQIQRAAVMIVIANATKYGTGVTINPLGRLDDEFFEIVIIRKISVLEILKMNLTRLPLNAKKTEVYQARSVEIRSRKKVHFQVDGEYLGKTNHLSAEILPASIRVIYPGTEPHA